MSINIKTAYLNLSKVKEEDYKTIPLNTEVDGYVSLPKLFNRFDLDTIHGCALNISHNLWLSEDIKSLPKKLSVFGGLIIKNCSHLTSLPNSLYVWGELTINKTPITSLPDNLHVGFLDISGCEQITSLPNKLKIKGRPAGLGKESMDLRGCKNIKELPSDLEIDGVIYCNINTGFMKTGNIPPHLSKYIKMIYGDKI